MSGRGGAGNKGRSAGGGGNGGVMTKYFGVIQAGPANISFILVLRFLNHLELNYVFKY